MPERASLCLPTSSRSGLAESRRFLSLPVSSQRLTAGALASSHHGHSTWKACSTREQKFAILLTGDCMPDVAWQKHNDIYTASISNLRALIIEHHDTDTFAARIETVNGETLQASQPLPDFEIATRWVLSSMVDVEQTLDRHNPYQRIFETLDLCKAKLSLITDSVHLQRLEHIRQWVVTRSTQEQEIADEWRQQANEKHQPTPLDWQALSTTDWYIDTPHGRAIIREIRPNTSLYGQATSMTHRAWIAHPNGASYEWNMRSIDFMAADAWVRQTLHELADPRVAERFVGSITFTLTICERLLADELDPMHTARINSIKEMLETVLP